MGFLDRFTGIKSIFGKSKDFDYNEKLEQMYGKEMVVGSYDEILKLTNKKFKETLDLNDQILEKYSKENGEDIQKKIMNKYLKESQDEILLEEQQIENEVDDVTKDIDGVDKNTKDQIKKDLEEEQKEDNKKGKVPDEKDRKKVLQAKIYEATYNRMYKNYANKVMRIKNAQYDSMAIGIGTAEAVSIIAMEKNMEKLDLLYHNHTGKDISQVQKIKENKEHFKSEFENNQKGIESRTDDRARRIEMLYKIRNEKYEAYIKALKDPNQSPQDKYNFKRQYEEANLDLIQYIPSMEEYTRDIQIQEKNEELAKDANLKQSAINSRIQNTDALRTKVTDSKIVENIQDIRKEEFKRDDISLEKTQTQQRDALNKGDYVAARQMDKAAQSKRIYDRNIENMPEQSNIAQTKKDVQTEENRGEADFRASLRAVRPMEDRSAQELQEIIEDRNKDAEEKIRENMHKEQVEQNVEQRVRQNKKPNG